MFLNHIKEFSLKRILKKSFPNVNSNINVTSIKSVGLLIDESYFEHKADLINELILNGFEKDNIKVLVFKDKINKNNVFNYPTFNNKQINLSGKFTENVIIDFIQEKFDLLISYYDAEKISLLLITNRSKASFKVGFSSIDKRCNNLMITTNTKNYKIFVLEMFKYLKILKKI